MTTIGNSAPEPAIPAHVAEALRRLNLPLDEGRALAVAPVVDMVWLSDGSNNFASEHLRRMESA